MIEEAKLLQLERDFPDGLSSVQILDLCKRHGIALSEATLRKYVQLGLLPRSVRVGEKGKHRGSKGLYPTRMIRRLLLIKEMMAKNVTIEQIQNDFLLLGVEVDEIGDSLSKLLAKIRTVIREGREEEFEQPVEELVGREVAEAERLSTTLISRLQRIEGHLRARDLEVGLTSPGVRAVS